MLGGARFACADYFKYVGILFTKQHNPRATAEDRPHTTGMLWLTKACKPGILWLTNAYDLPASMCACKSGALDALKD
eukprot:463360-Pelagomonas_calceolata.AAC.3